MHPLFCHLAIDQGEHKSQLPCFPPPSPPSTSHIPISSFLHSFCRPNARFWSPIRTVRPAASALAPASVQAPLKPTLVLKPTDPTGDPVPGVFGTPQRGVPEPLGASLDKTTVRRHFFSPFAFFPFSSLHFSLSLTHINPLKHIYRIQQILPSFLPMHLP